MVQNKRLFLGEPFDKFLGGFTHKVLEFPLKMRLVVVSTVLYESRVGTVRVIKNFSEDFGKTHTFTVLLWPEAIPFRKNSVDVAGTVAGGSGQVLQGGKAAAVKNHLFYFFDQTGC